MEEILLLLYCNDVTQGKIHFIWVIKLSNARWLPTVRKKWRERSFSKETCSCASQTERHINIYCIELVLFVAEALPPPTCSFAFYRGCYTHNVSHKNIITELKGILCTCMIQVTICQIFHVTCTSYILCTKCAEKCCYEYSVKVMNCKLCLSICHSKDQDRICVLLVI